MTKSDKNHPQRTIYIEDELFDWFESEAKMLSEQEGQRVTRSQVIRRAMREYMEREEEKNRPK
jgi:hypothetical protein